MIRMPATPMRLRSILDNMSKAPRILFAKHTVVRLHAPIELDPQQFTADDYSKIVPEMRRAEASLLAKPASADGLRWIHRGPLSYFHGTRVLDHDFEELVRRVDIADAGAFYRDSISLEELVVERDALERPTRQLVRIVALPQPNYSGLFGKGNLDIYKLERIDYTDTSCTIWMWTAHSPNGSAICDDGYLRFSEGEREGTTTVSFLACQEFPYPAVMEWLQMHRWGWMRRLLTESAYRRFFDRMVGNIEDAFLGRDFAVGVEPDPEAVASLVIDR